MTKRFFFSCVTIFFVIAFNFFLFRVMPGNVETIIAKANTSEAVKARLLEEAGLDQPLMTQFGIYLKQLVTGDFGESFYTYDGSSDVLHIIAGRLPNTVVLLLCAEVARRSGAASWIPGCCQGHWFCIPCRPSGLPCC